MGKKCTSVVDILSIWGIYIVEGIVYDTQQIIEKCSTFAQKF